MILRLLVDFYAWVWGVEAWRPSAREDYGIVIMGAALIDPIAVVAICFGVYQIVKKIRGGAR